MLDEYQAIERRLKDQETIVVLDVDGKVLSTEAIAESIGAWQDPGTKVASFAGQTVYTRNLRLGSAVVSRAHHASSPLGRVILAEQLYRAWSRQRRASLPSRLSS